MEVPVRRLLMGVPPEQAMNRSAAADPEAFDSFVDYVQRQGDYQLSR